MKKLSIGTTTILASLIGFTLTTMSPLALADDALSTTVSVNGTKISDALIKVYQDGMSQQNQQKIGKDQAVDELIQQQVLVQEAKRQGLDKAADVQAEITLRTNDVLARKLVFAYLNDHPASSEETHKAFKELEPKIMASGQEYKASHIVVKTEAEAQAIIDELKKGADFAQLAKTKSTGPSGKNGGELGWFKNSAMPPEFAETMSHLKKGETSTKPTHTTYGWHVIKFEDERHPSYEDVEEQLKNYVQQQKVVAYIDELKTKAKIVK